jgi:phosphinothricin acetyltransferase
MLMAERVVFAGPAVVVRDATAADNPQIAGIWNHEVLFTSATTATEPRSPEEQRQWLAQHGDSHPVIVVARGDEVLGFGSLSPYKAKPAYAHAVEDSVYVKDGARGMGLGALLLGRLVELAREGGYRTIIARITAGNAPSVRLHERYGFGVAGVERRIAFKQGRHHDVVTMQRMLDGEGETGVETPG